ncbi:MAG: hypothetical protein NTU83_11560 [Candidatus Hydrogenedentes bacterium]|nr:hypothetical protein [Candidatus Hydrogenedentota bacterium]
MMVRLRNLALTMIVLVACFGVCSHASAAGTAKAAKAKPKAAPAVEKPVAPVPAPSGTLMAVPAAIHFDSTHGAAQVALFFDETPAKAAHITKATLLLKGYMFEVTRAKTDPGVVTVATNPNTVEDGSSSLEIVAGGQTINVEVFVNLAPGTPASERTELPARMDFDKSYKKGATLEYKLEAPLDADYVWTVNGKVVKQGPGEIKLVYTFDETGPQIIRVNMKAPNGKAFESVGKTEVVP